MAFLNRPLYLQVRDVLAERIASGGLLPGSAIPSESDLAREIGVSPGTVRKALQLMEADRLIVRRQGRGTFVNDPACDELLARFAPLRGPGGVRIHGQIRQCDIVRRRASPAERARLRLSDDDEVFRVQRVHHINGTPFLVEDAALPAQLFPGLDDKRRVADHISALAQEYHVLLGSAAERVSSAVPPAPIAATLRTPPGVPVVVLDRVVGAFGNGRPVEWRVAHSHLPGSYYLAELR